MAYGNVKKKRQARHKALKGRPLQNKHGVPLNHETANTGNLNAAWKAVRRNQK